MKFTLYTANVTQKANNTKYPNRIEVTSEEELIGAVSRDTVCAEFKGHHRSTKNYIRGDCIMMDIDNDHSEDPSDWITPEKLAAELEDVNYAAVPSRNNGKSKKGKPPRSKLHVFFPINTRTAPEEVTALKRKIWVRWPFFDKGALDAAHFAFGAATTEVYWHEGIFNIDDALSLQGDEEDDALSLQGDEEDSGIPGEDKIGEIPEGSRNRTMHSYALSVLTSLGDTEEARTLYDKKADTCNPPLGTQELETIYRSAQGYYQDTISKDKGYIPPEKYKALHWKSHLARDKKGRIITSLLNLETIMKYDPLFNCIGYNTFSHSIEATADLPWRPKILNGTAIWRDADDAQLVSYLANNYVEFGGGKVFTALQKAVDERRFHPVRDYFKSLPPWDGVKRVDTLLIDHLGAEDTEYVRTVTRKALCAAVKRIQNPGCKYDYMLVLVGPQGIGKSTLISLLGKDWFSDSLTLADAHDKSGPEKMQGHWIMEVPELSGLRKMDVETLKSFISRQDDQYRAAYARRVESHPRQSIFIGTTNAEDGFLRDTTGGRRFWPVRVYYRKKDPEDIDQIWAEALVLAETEPLYLNADEEHLAAIEQRSAVEKDPKEGQIRDYLERLLPDNWYDLTTWERRSWLEDSDETGTLRREVVCLQEIWAEALKLDIGRMTRKDSFELSNIMQRIEGWDMDRNKTKRFRIYGPQKYWKRT